MKNQDLFDTFKKTHWQDMPEFVQEEQEPYAKITIRVANEKDLNELSEMLGQKLTKKTKSIWHPALPKRGTGNVKRWVRT
jgi:hypothetical protein